MNAPAAQSRPYAAPAAPPPLTPAPVLPHISVDVVTVASSPLTRAAASLLLLLGRLRASLARAGASQLMDQVAQAIEQFEKDARAGGAPADQIEPAKYALAATADDIVQNLPSEDSRVWTQYSMLVRYFNERMGGVRFFQELDRAKQNPAVNLGLLELMHECLSLGFEGVYRATGGQGELQTSAATFTRRSGAISPRRSRTFPRTGAGRRSRWPEAGFSFRSGRSPRPRALSSLGPIWSCATCCPVRPKRWRSRWRRSTPTRN
jgi:type IV/VI secretion system ImpK/VasF family protein